MHHFVFSLRDVPDRRADVDSLLAGPLGGPLGDGLEIVQRLMALELGHDFVEQVRVDLGLFVPAAEALVRAFEEFQVLLHVCGGSGVVVAVAAVDFLPEDLLVDGHGVGVATFGGVQFGEEDVHLQCGLVQGPPHAT